MHFIYTQEQMASLQALRAKERAAVEAGKADPNKLTRRWRDILDLTHRGKC